MSSKASRPALSLQTILSQEPTKRTSLLQLFCPWCGSVALTEKYCPGVYRVSCGGCHTAVIVQTHEKAENAG